VNEDECVLCGEPVTFVEKMKSIDANQPVCDECRRAYDEEPDPDEL
jgi:recombinational DNA repair protein (RecF pathway)